MRAPVYCHNARWAKGESVFPETANPDTGADSDLEIQGPNRVRSSKIPGFEISVDRHDNTRHNGDLENRVFTYG